MLMRILFVTMLSLLTVSCGGPRYIDYFPYHDDGTAKPHVAFVPVLNGMGDDLPAGLDTQINRTVRLDLMDHSLLYLYSPQDVQKIVSAVGEIDFIESDADLAAQFKEADFIVLIETVEHSTKPCAVPNMCTLTIKSRVRVVDARCREPRTALQEIITQEYTVNGEPGVCDAFEEYYKQSCVRVHREYASYIAKRLEAVILSVF